RNVWEGKPSKTCFRYSQEMFTPPSLMLTTLCAIRVSGPTLLSKKESKSSYDGTVPTTQPIDSRRLHLFRKINRILRPEPLSAELRKDLSYEDCCDWLGICRPGCGGMSV